MIGLSLFHGNAKDGINYEDGNGNEDGNDEEGNDDLFRNVSAASAPSKSQLGSQQLKDDHDYNHIDDHEHRCTAYQEPRSSF